MDTNRHESLREQLNKQVQAWLDTWAPHCGASRKTFEGQWRAMMAEIFDNIEHRAEANMLKTHKLEGMHYAAMKDVRRELQLRNPIPFVSIRG